MTVNTTAAVEPDAPGKRPLRVVGSRDFAEADARDRPIAGAHARAMRTSPFEPQVLSTRTAARGPGLALRNYGLAELDVAIASLSLRGSHVHAGVHQARKAMRRTRAMLALGVATLGPGAKLIDHQLRASNRRTSPLRDAQALVETLDRLRPKARDDATRAALDHARRIAARRRAAMAKQPEFTHALQHEEAIVATLRAALLGLPWDRITTPMVAEAMVLADQRAASARERACERDDADAWHRWRRRMRRISQQHRAANAAGLPVSDTEFDKNVTEQLGVLQDLNLLVAHCGDDSPFSTSRSMLRRFAERALAKQRKRIRSVVDLAGSNAAGPSP